MYSHKKNKLLNQYKKNITSYSQFGEDGEDGILQKIFEILGVKKGWCVEFGALDGKHHSNTWYLLHNKEWSGVLIEADMMYFRKLEDVYREDKRVTCLNEFITFEGNSSLDAILSRTSLPRDYDLLSIDIDGNDYHIWDSSDTYIPKVIIIEFNPSIPNDIEFVQPKDMRVNQGSSLLSIVKLGKAKGYKLIATTGWNAFFVKQELYSRFGINDNSINTLHTNHQYETRLFQLFDGTLVLDGCKKLLWHNREIDPEAIQVLPQSKRKYPARISDRKSRRSMKDLIRRSPLYPFVKYLKGKFFS